MTPLIDTARLRLRAPMIGDARRITDFLGNISVSGNLARVPHPYSLDHARTWLTGWRADASPHATSFVIELKGEGAIGVIGNDLRENGAEIGYWIGEPFWGRGLLTEAMKAMLGWYFAVTPAEEIRSGMFHFNMASLAIQQKLGFVETGRSMRHCLARGEDVEHIDTELTREAFEALGPRSAAELRSATRTGMASMGTMMDNEKILT